MAVNQGPCDWPVVHCGEQSPGWVNLTAEYRQRYEDAAVEWLWRWTGRTLGLCSAVIRPCRSERNQASLTGSAFQRTLPWTGSPWTPALIGGSWYNLTCGMCGDDCACDGGSVIRLPREVYTVTSIKIDGVVLPASSWRLDSENRLIRLDGEDWPSYQDETQPDTAQGTWSITVQYGRPVPEGGQIAAGVLAVELWKASCGDPSCGLPRRIQTITRQGVSIAMIDSFDDVERGHTGIWVIDSWVTSMNQPERRSAVFSPDVPRRGVQWLSQ